MLATFIKVSEVSKVIIFNFIFVHQKMVYMMPDCIVGSRGNQFTVTDINVLSMIKIPKYLCPIVQILIDE